MKISDIIPDTSIHDGLAGADAKQVIKEMVAKLVAAGQLPEALEKEATKALLKREAAGTTALGKGIAVPHAKIGGLANQIGAFGRSGGGADFKALDGEPVFGVFMVLTPEEYPELNLKALGAISLICRHDRLLMYLRDAKDEKEIAGLLADAEEITERD